MCSSRSPRPRSAAPTCTSITGTPGRRRPSRCPWPSATSTSAASSTWAAKCAASRVGDRVSGEGHLTCGHLPQLPRRPPSPLPQHRGRGRGPPGLLRRVPVHPREQRVQAHRCDHRRHREHPRSVRQRHAHRPRLQHGGRRRADHRRRPHRHHGGRHRQARRRAPRGHHRRERLPAGPREEDGRHARHQRHARKTRRRHARARHAGGLRRGTRDVGQPDARSATCSAPCIMAAAWPC